MSLPVACHIGGFCTGRFVLGGRDPQLAHHSTHHVAQSAASRATLDREHCSHGSAPSHDGFSEGLGCIGCGDLLWP